MLLSLLVRPSLHYRYSSSLKKPRVITGSYRRTTSAVPAKEESTVAPLPFVRANVGTAPGSPHPTLRHVPKLPLIGSMWPAYSGIPSMKPTSVFSFWPTLHQQYGDFYTLGIPGLGVGLWGTVHVIHDPVEMARIVRQEGVYPAGAVEFLWPLIHHSKEHGSALRHMFGKGPGWKRIRSFMQTDLLNPQAAARYGPAVLESAAHLSTLVKTFHEGGGRLNDYLNMASFSMFSNVLLGQLPRGLAVSASPEAASADSNDDVEFCQAVSSSLRLNSALVHSPFEAIITTQFGYKTKAYREFEAAWDTVQTMARRKVEALYEKRNSNTLTDAERDSYSNLAFERHEASALSSSPTTGTTSADSDNAKKLSVEEVKSIIIGLLAGAVDTTGGLLAWKLLHVALSESTQSTIYIELTQSMKRHDTKTLIPECLSSTEAPMLHAAMREAHRLSNPTPIVPIKILQESTVVHGLTLPPGSVVILDGYTTGIRPDIVGDDALVFDPTRFLPEAVEARKQASSNGSVLDHPFFAGPFSQGARRCPGSRVANVEVTALIAQLVLDWHISVPGVENWTDVPYDREALIVVQLPEMMFTSRA